MKKKFLSLALSAMIGLSLTACGEPTAAINTTKDNTVKEEPSASEEKKEVAVGETWEVDGQWKLTVNSVTETADRNEFSDKEPAAVYIIDYTYENIGYEDDFMDGLYINPDSGQIVDAANNMGYSYPVMVDREPEEVPVGASITAQTAIGVDNPGDFKINLSEHANNEKYPITLICTVG